MPLSLRVERELTISADFYDHYFDLLTYLRARQERLHALHSELGVVEPSQSATAAHEERVARHRAHESSLLRSRRVRVQPEHFHIITQVGQGGYGEVFLARARHGIAGTKGGAVVALKRMRKRTLAKLDEVRHVLTERDILASTHSDWLVRLLYAFQDAEFVYLAMDFVPGGDFRTLLNNSGVLKEEHARFYMSEMVSAVAALHKLGYIHRDLKPEVRPLSLSGRRRRRVADPGHRSHPRARETELFDRQDGPHQADRLWSGRRRAQPRQD